MKKSLFLFGLYVAAIFLATRYIPQETLRALIDNSGELAPLVYIILTLVAFIAAPMSASPLLYVGYFAFGQWVIWYSTVATILSFVTNYWIAKRWGYGYVHKLLGKRTADKVDTLAKEYGLVTLFLMRALQGGIHEIVSYAAGLTPLTFWPYFWVSMAGLIPGTLFWWYVSTQVSDPLAFTVVSNVVALMLSGVFVAGALIVRLVKRQSATPSASQSSKTGP